MARKNSSSPRLDAPDSADPPAITVSDDVKVYVRKPPKKGGKHRILVIDIGSNSIKATGYEVLKSRLRAVFKYGEQCGLGADAIPDDENPTLSPKGMRRALKKVFPDLKKKINHFRPHKIVVVCTEAVRAALQSKDEHQREIVKEFIRNTARILEIPIECITIASGNLEIDLTEAAVKLAFAKKAGKSDKEGPTCLVIGGGGNSHEISGLKHGERVPHLRALWRIGSRSLLGWTKRKIYKIVDKKIEETPSLRADTVEAEGINELCAPGGLYRNLGRLIAERRYGRDPSRNCMPPGGYAFTWKEAKRTMLRLRSLTPKRAYIHTFGASHREIMQKRKKGKNGWYVVIKGKKVRETTYAYRRRQNFQNRVTNRFDSLPVAIGVLIRLVKHIFPKAESAKQPLTITFPKESIREPLAHIAAAYNPSLS